MVGDRGDVSLKVLKKGRHWIRATVTKRNRNSESILYFRKESLDVINRLPEGIRTKKLSPMETASNLIDLMALNPIFHFGQQHKYSFKSPELANFKVRIDREPPEYNQSLGMIRSIRLIHSQNKSQSVVRTIRFKHAKFDGDGNFHPHTLRFLDEQSQDVGKVIVQRIDYNLGLPDFLFEPPDISGGTGPTE